MSLGKMGSFSYRMCFLRKLFQERCCVSSNLSYYLKLLNQILGDPC